MRSAILGVLAAALLLSGCATMSESECLTVEWQTIGFEDGVAGYSGDRIGQHRKACAKHGVSPDLVGYQRGREAGLREYCQPANGFRVGSHGSSYAGICPAELEGAFTAAYDSGRQLYSLESRLNNARNQVVSKRRELERVEDSIVKATAVILRSESTGEERAQALVDTKQLAERAGRLKAEIRQLERDEVEYERDLEDYRARVAFIG
jgi:Protein of unknown function (DUF2799)